MTAAGAGLSVRTTSNDARRHHAAMIRLNIEAAIPWLSPGTVGLPIRDAMLRTELLDYHLPPELVATRPADRRDESRLMVVWRRDPERVDHRVFRDLPALLAPGDLLVFNTSAVLPARFTGFREDTGGKVEGLFLGMAAPGDGGQAGAGEILWLAMVKSRRFRPGAHIRLRRRDNTVSEASLELAEASAEVPGAWIVRVAPGDEAPEGDPRARTQQLLERVGRPPLPPYIRSARRASGLADETPEDVERYQTVYARAEAPGAGSVAAPTAGLHFTPQLLEALGRRGVERADVQLHVGAGTFRTVEAETVEAHDMHAELCAMPAEAVEAVGRARAAGARVIPVGSTSLRTLESYARWIAAHPRDTPPQRLWTDLLLTPGAEILWTDGLLTNFHLPRSTLLALVASLLDADPQRASDRLRGLYQQAVDRRYRFYSYGDAMLVLP
jgi:S-adenosylmethionine:tRNA ribosyltransferase-isomerase